MGQKYAYARLSELYTAPINFNTSGDHIIVPATPYTRIGIQRIWFVCSSGTQITIKDGTSQFTGPLSMGQDGGFTLDTTGEAWFITSLGNSFIINSSDNVQVSGICYYTTSTTAPGPAVSHSVIIQGMQSQSMILQGY